MQPHLTFLASLILIASLTACGESGDGGHAHGPESHAHNSASSTPDAESGGHVHADGKRHDGPAHAPSETTPPAGTHTHADGSVHGTHDRNAPADDHAGVAIGPVQIGDMNVQLAQGHGAIAAGKESHLVVLMPYEDNGETVVRAWIGSEDRTLSFVGRGDYSSSPSRYDIHAVAPNPLPNNAKWWIEIEKPDGTKALGSATPIR